MKVNYFRRDFLRIACTLITACSTGAQTQNRCNILLVLSDDHSVPHVGCYGNQDIKTPNLDRFAAEGIRFERVYASSPQCVPARAALMTGRSPVAIQMTRFSAPLPIGVRTYPELLRAQGYFTGLAGRTYHLDGEAVNSDPLIKEIYDNHKVRTFQDRFDFVRTGSMRKGIEQFSEFLDLKPKNKPFFLQLCSNDPHRKFEPNVARVPHDAAKLTLAAHFPDTPLTREDFALYYDKISRFDDDFGIVMKMLEDRGLASNTLVAFMGDNGAALLRGKGTLYEFGIHVPLIMRWPGKIKPGRASSELISGEDLAPTFLEACGVTVPKEMTGVSAHKILRDERAEGRNYLFAERGAHHIYLPKGSASFDLGRCVVGRRDKFIYNALARNTSGKLSPHHSRIYFAATRPMYELYDLEKDTGEFENLVGRAETAAIEKELRTVLIERMVLECDFLPLPISEDPVNGLR